MRLAILLLVASCAADPYRSSLIRCVENSTTRSQADACRARLVEAGVLTVTADAGVPHG